MARIKPKQQKRAQREAREARAEAAAIAAISGGNFSTANEFMETTPGVSAVPATLLPEVIALQEEQRKSQEETDKVAEETAAQIAFLDQVIKNVPDLAKGNIAAINQGGPVNFGADFDQNAFDIVKDLLKQYDIEELESVVRGWIENKVSEEAAIANLRGTDAYKTRFKGNELRRAAGLNVFDEGTYLAQENDYEEWARYYGVLGKLGDTTQKRRETFANLMANSVFTPEYKTRLETYVDRVDRGDPGIKRTLRSFYNITDDDLLNYFINPKENIKVLQEKVTAAEIGAAATAQGLGASRARAEDLARFGIDRATAIAGYQDIAAALPRGQMLGGIYREEGIDYTQQTAEEEEFKQMESARRARRRLAEREAATFGGGSAVARGSLGSSTAGAI